VAFFDYNLSDMDGAKLLQIYRFGKARSAPVFFLTADATAITTEKLSNSGAAGVLHKPASIRELRAAVSKVCRNTPDADSGKSTGSVRGDRGHLRPVPVQLLDTARIESLRMESRRPGFLRELLLQAQNDIDLNCSQLVQALETGDVETIRESAHALKGVCVNIGAVRLAGLSSSLMAIRRGDINSPGQLVVDLETLRAATSESVSQVIAEIDLPGQKPDLSARLH